MSVNALNIEDVYQILNSIHQQATGRTSLAPTNTGEFVSMATTTLATGVDTVYNALMNTLGQTVFAVRPYERKFSGLVVDNVRWGAIRRKISYADKALSEAEKAWHKGMDRREERGRTDPSDRILLSRKHGELSGDSGGL